MSSGLPVSARPRHGHRRGKPGIHRIVCVNTRQCVQCSIFKCNCLSRQSGVGSRLRLFVHRKCPFTVTNLPRETERSMTSVRAELFDLPVKRKYSKFKYGDPFFSFPRRLTSGDRSHQVHKETFRVSRDRNPLRSAFGKRGLICFCLIISPFVLITDLISRYGR